jgi:site-specific DNA-methyltransferase (adenine-specific)
MTDENETRNAINPEPDPETVRPAMKAHYSSQRGDWTTPQWLRVRMMEIFGKFSLDAAANYGNSLADRFFSEQISGLERAWTDITFCNPPYGRGIGRWTTKAEAESCAVVMLLPARTDTTWFQDLAESPRCSCVCFLSGRLKFGGGKPSAPFPSALVVIGMKLTQAQINGLEELGLVVFPQERPRRWWWKA